MSTKWIALCPARAGRLSATLAALGAGAALAALGACSSPATPGSTFSLSHPKRLDTAHAAAAHTPSKGGRPGAPAAAELVAAVGGDRTDVPVEVRFALRARPEVGTPVELDVAVTPTGPVGRLVMSFHAEDGLTLEGGGAWESDRPEPGTSLSRALTIVARRDGIFCVNATVLVDSGTDSVARTFTIPVIAGAGAS